MLLLIVDDDPSILRNLESFLKKNFTVDTCNNGSKAFELIQSKSYDLVLSDNKMPGMTGLELLKKTKEFSPNTAFVIMTAFGSDDESLDAVKLGADDYLMKPFNLTEVGHRVGRISDLKSWSAENTIKEEEGLGLKRLIGKSPSILDAKKFVTQVAGASSPVLILGETGTGKELLARAIHESSSRAPHPFIAINCGALNENLIESELFGHEKGSFTGASQARAGKFELAKRGTIFLDELGELPLNLQTRLLRIMQEQQFYRLGGTRLIESDARVIAATHRPLQEMVTQGAFREDLYFRFNVLTYSMPPLVQRGEDIPLLIEHFMQKFHTRSGKTISLSNEAKNLLYKYSFPGNVRELQNLIERLFVLAPKKGTITQSHLPPEVQSNNQNMARGITATSLPEGGLEEAINTFETQLLLKAMDLCQHNQSEAARYLKVERSTLRYKLKKIGYEAPKSNDKEAA
ncbi:MAG: sigma-54-dependent transcriptional regulator [Deltaproteobacteria bacterium]|jgi:DNA-binding NtrC family response regulator